MKKILFIFVLSLSIFDILPKTATFTLPAWFKKHKIINTTDYPIIVRASFSGYNSPSAFNQTLTGADQLGILIEAKSNSNDPKTRLFEVGDYGVNAENNSLMVFGIFKINQEFVRPSALINNPKEKDYTVKLTKDGSVDQAPMFILEEQK